MFEYVILVIYFLALSPILIPLFITYCLIVISGYIFSDNVVYQKIKGLLAPVFMIDSLQ